MEPVMNLPVYDQLELPLPRMGAWPDSRHRFDPDQIHALRAAEAAAMAAAATFVAFHSLGLSREVAISASVLVGVGLRGGALARAHRTPGRRRGASGPEHPAAAGPA